MHVLNSLAYRNVKEEADDNYVEVIDLKGIFYVKSERVHEKAMFLK